MCNVAGILHPMESLPTRRLFCWWTFLPLLWFCRGRVRINRKKRKYRGKELDFKLWWNIESWVEEKLDLCWLYMHDICKSESASLIITHREVFGLANQNLDAIQRKNCFVEPSKFYCWTFWLEELKNFVRVDQFFVGIKKYFINITKLFGIRNKF